MLKSCLQKCFTQISRRIFEIIVVEAALLEYQQLRRLNHFHFEKEKNAHSFLKKSLNMRKMTFENLKLIKNINNEPN